MIFIMVRLWPRIYCKVDPKTQRGFVVPRIVRPGETLSSTQYERRAGGKGANQAVAIAKAGAKVSLSACIGQDGTWIMRILKDAGVNTEEVSKSESVRYMNIGTLTKLNWLLYYVGTYRTRCNPSHSWRRELYSWVWLPPTISINSRFICSSLPWCQLRSTTRWINDQHTVYPLPTTERNSTGDHHFHPLTRQSSKPHNHIQSIAYPIWSGNL